MKRIADYGAFIVMTGCCTSQRLGSSLNPHYHFHVLALDGVISGNIQRGVRFHEATGLEALDAEFDLSRLGC